MTPLETERLILRTWKPEDFDAFADIHADPEVTRFITPEGKPLSRFEAWRAFTSLIGHWFVRGFGMFAVVERSSGELVGRIGPWQPEGWPGFEVGWSLGRKYWGRGYATEAVRTCITYSFEQLGRSNVISLIDPDNVRSIAVAERVGERLQGDATLPHVPDKVILKYGVSREDWPEL
jgi:RimJ/RimL family protein N-acetyltransferase